MNAFANIQIIDRLHPRFQMLDVYLPGMLGCPQESTAELRAIGNKLNRTGRYQYVGDLVKARAHQLRDDGLSEQEIDMARAWLQQRYDFQPLSRVRDWVRPCDRKRQTADPSRIICSAEPHTLTKEDLDELEEWLNRDSERPRASPTAARAAKPDEQSPTR